MSMSTMQFSSYTNMPILTKIFINTKVTWSYVFGSACPVAMEKRGHIRKDWMGWYGGLGWVLGRGKGGAFLGGWGHRAPITLEGLGF